MAPQVAQFVGALTQQGRLRFHTGRVTAAFADDMEAEVRIRFRGKLSLEILHVNRVINCTAPEADYRKLTHPLWSSLFGRGLVAAGPNGLGLRTGPDGELIDAAGQPSENLFTLGPTRIGSLLETTSVPAIRTQSAAVAARLNDLESGLPFDVSSPQRFPVLGTDGESP